MNFGNKFIKLTIEDTNDDIVKKGFQVICSSSIKSIHTSDHKKGWHYKSPLEDTIER